MSLVNDMLRDLDKRRKESSGGAGSVSLTPAPEIPIEAGKRSIMLYLFVALVIGAGAIAWFWMQQDGDGTSRDLNIAPRIANESGVQLPVAEPVTTETASGLPENDTGTGAEETLDESAVAANGSQSGVDEIDAGQNVVAVAEAASAAVEQPREVIPDQTAQQSTRPEAEALPTDDTAALAADNNQESNPESTSQLAQSESPQTAPASNTVDLGEAPAGDVKNATALSPEERDVRAVQRALQLIAENKTIEAYGALEQEILDNRYAHQTRETYAKLLLNEGNQLGAFELVEAGLDLSPNHRGFKKVKARLLIAQGRLNDAVDLLLSRAPPVDTDLEYHEILATAQLASRDYEGALISYSGLVREDQSQGRWWYGFAASQDSLGNLNAARQGYSRAVSLSNLSANLRRRSQERLAVLGQ